MLPLFLFIFVPTFCSCFQQKRRTIGQSWKKQTAAGPSSISKRMQWPGRCFFCAQGQTGEEPDDA
jgi:hypothetical protein